MTSTWTSVAGNPPSSASPPGPTGTAARAVTLVPSVGGAPEARDYLALFDLDVRRLAEALRAR